MLASLATGVGVLCHAIFWGWEEFEELCFFQKGEWPWIYSCNWDFHFNESTIVVT